MIQSSESLRAYKPHRAVFLAACERLGVAPNETLYVGDSAIADVGGAHNAGLRTVWVRRASESRDPVTQPSPDADGNGDGGASDMMSRLPVPDLTVDNLLGISEALAGTGTG